MGLVVKRQEDETWREAVIRYAKPYGLERECLEIYDADVSNGTDESRAAWNALYEWDVLEFVDD